MYGVRGTMGHVDEFCRFANANTILLAWIDESEIGKDPVKRITYERMQENLKILQQSTDQAGNTFTIIKVPYPLIEFRKRIMSESNPFYKNIKRTRPDLKPGTVFNIVPTASYLNYIITNGVILLPAYWQPGMSVACKERDQQILTLFKNHFPTHKLIQVNSINLNYSSGGMHCVTQQQPAGKL